jgi:hypothetical protein
VIDPRIDAVQAWLQREDGRLGDIFGLWTQGKRDDGWVADRLVTEGHLAALIEDAATPAPLAQYGPVAPGHVCDVHCVPGEHCVGHVTTPAPLDERCHCGHLNASCDRPDADFSTRIYKENRGE